MQKEPTKKAAGKRNARANPPRKLSRAEKKQIAEVIRQAKGDGKAHTAQQTIPYLNGHCILLDDGDECVCPQLISYSLLCKWFRIAVLPLDKLLYAELFKTEDKKRCTVCGAFFASRSNSVKYCPDCRKRITNRQAAERMRKRRALVTR